MTGWGIEFTYHPKSSKYKYVNKMTGPKGIVRWRANACGTSKWFKTEREAAVAVDKILLIKGKKPVNILVKK